MPSDPDPAIDYYENGKPRFRGFHLDGEMHGEWTFYRKDGSVLRSGAFERGRQVVLAQLPVRSGVARLVPQRSRE